MDCNLSMADLNQSTLNNIHFKNCKMLGVKFNHCHDFIFHVDFENCILDYASFEKRKMSKTRFKDTSLKGVDFGGADLKQSKFLEADLEEAIFYNTNIQEVDFTTAYNYSIDLSQNQIKKACFSKDGLAGLLNQFDIIID
ncbi:MAG: pentapeptide repeat-containing protein [Dysgonomonas mossii]